VRSGRLGIWAATLASRLQGARRAPTLEQCRSSPILRPGGRAPGGTGLVAIDPPAAGCWSSAFSGGARRHDLRSWVIPKGGKPKSAGLFDGGGSTTVVRLGEGVPRGSVVAATIERSGGADAPTQTPIITAQT
jgi:hypothetical protein